MIRKLFLFILLTGFLALMAFFFYKFNEKKPIKNDFYAAVPTQSIWLMQIRNASTLFATLKGTNIIYEELVRSHVWAKWRGHFSTLDSFVNINPIKYQGYQNIPVIIAMVPSGVGSSDLLLSFIIQDEMDKKQVFKDLFLPIVGEKPKSHKDYDGAIIQNYSREENVFFLCFYKGYFLFSSSEIVVEDAVRQLNTGVSLTDEPSFNRIMETAGSSRKVNWYVHQKAFSKHLSTFVDKHHNFSLQNGMGLPEWTELDLWLKPNTMMFNGYCFSGNNKKEFMEVFKGQVAGPNNVADILPINTAFFINYSISNFSDFTLEYKNYLKSNNWFSNFEKRQLILNDLAQRLTDSILIKNVGSEVCLAVLEIQNDVDGESVSAIFDKTLSILRLKNPDLWLDDIVDLIEPNTTDFLYINKYREVDIYEMSVSGIVSKNIGGIFDGMENRFFIILDDYVVFGEKLSTIRELINSWKGGKVLSEDEHFESFSENMASVSNLTIFASPARSPYFLSYYLNKNEQDWVEGKLDFFRKFEGLSIQITRENDNMTYYSVFLKHNPSYKKVTSSLWEIPLDTSVLAPPQLFDNHYTKAGEIIVQDVNNKLYLISNTGRILWSRQIEGLALSTFYKVDKFKNDKFQLLFNTSNKIYLIDRNGKDVKGFPISLKKDASAELSLMDYERNKKYRLLQPLKDGSIVCYDINGEVVKGWKYQGKKMVNRKITYLEYDGKDYLLAFYKDGSVQALNRKGQTRISFKESFYLAENSNIRIQKGEEPKSTYIVGSDSSGNVMRLSLTGKMELLQFGNFSSQHNFTMADFNNDKIEDYVFSDHNKFVVYSSSGNQDLKIEEDFSIGFHPGIYRSPIKNYVAMGSKNRDNIWLYNFYGKKVDGNPFLGNSKPVISDINLDGRLELISTSTNGIVYCYVLN